MITLSDITLQRGSKLLFKFVNLIFHAKQKIGVVGKNGSGKTSLFLMLLGQIEPSQGDLSLASNLNIVTVQQDMSVAKSSALDFVLDADQPLRQLQTDLHQAQQEKNGHRIAELYMHLENVDGYTAETRAAKILYGLGFSDAQFHQPVNELSGGWRMRLNIARALFVPSDVLLLDEPTNHLDLDAVIWLEQWLIQYPGTLFLISHDREFLDCMVTHVVHIEFQQIKFYTGNYAAFEKQRAESLALQQKQYEKQQQYITHIQSYINRFRAKATKARQAQSRIKALEKLQKIMPAHVDTPFTFEFRAPKALPNPLLTMEHVSFGYDVSLVLGQIDFQIELSDRIALLGKNGAGKSTLIKLLASELQAQVGTVVTNKQLKVGYFAQHSLEQLREDQSALAHLRNIDATERELVLRKFLGGFDFSGDMALSPIKTFSGGERARLALALIIWQRPNLLLLDEPTNHLDLDMRQALILALQNYSGAIIVVSHDRFLLRNIVDDYYLVADKKVELFKGGLDDYQTWLMRRSSKQSEPINKEKQKTSRKTVRRKEAEDRTRLYALTKQIKAIDQTLKTEQALLRDLDAQLADESVYKSADKDQFQLLLIQRGKIAKQIEALEKEWMELQAQIDA